MNEYLFTTLPSNDLGLLTRFLPIARELWNRWHHITFRSPVKAPNRLQDDAGFDNLHPAQPRNALGPNSQMVTINRRRNSMLAHVHDYQNRKTMVMSTRLFQAACVLLVVLLMWPALIFGQELKAIQLFEPQLDGGRPLMQVLKDRRSSRAFSTEKLPKQVLSNLLWAAFGINRPDSGKRTAPSTMN